MQADQFEPGAIPGIQRRIQGRRVRTGVGDHVRPFDTHAGGEGHAVGVLERLDQLEGIARQLRPKRIDPCLVRLHQQQHIGILPIDHRGDRIILVVGLEDVERQHAHAGHAIDVIGQRKLAFGQHRIGPDAVEVDRRAEHGKADDQPPMPLRQQHGNYDEQRRKIDRGFAHEIQNAHQTAICLDQRNECGEQLYQREGQQYRARPMPVSG